MSLQFDESKHEYKLDGMILPSVTEVLRSVGLTNFIHDEVSMQLGTDVHGLIQAYESKWTERDPVPDHMRGYLSGWQNFKNMMSFKPILVEVPLASRLGYAGRFDIFGELRSDLALIDIKTGKAGFAAGIQLAAYKQLIVENFTAYHDKRIKEYAMELEASGAYRLKEFNGYDRWGVYQSALNVVNYKRRHNAVPESSM